MANPDLTAVRRNAILRLERVPGGLANRYPGNNQIYDGPLDRRDATC